MADDSEENKHIEIDEVQEFSGGEISSIEPIAEGDTKHGVHGAFHEYSGGQILERTDTVISPIIWVFWSFVGVCIIAAVVFLGLIPRSLTGGVQIGGGGQYDRPEGTTTQGYMSATAAMNTNASFVVLTSPALIDMYELPRPKGQELLGSHGAISAGSDVYQQYCIGCHGPNQDGNGPNSVSLDPKPRNLRDEPFMQAMSYQRIWTSVHKGVPGTAMPRWENVITDAQIQDVICYVLSLTAPTDPKSGQFIRPSAQDIAGSSPASQSGLGATYTAPQ